MIKDAPLDPTTGQRVNPFASYGTPKKGDFLYKDLNGDGVIDDNDKYAVGAWTCSPFDVWLLIRAEWNGFDFSCLFQEMLVCKYIGRINFIWDILIMEM